MEYVAEWLAIPSWKVVATSLTYRGHIQRVNALCQDFLESHPAPCWKIVAIALWRTCEFQALEQLQNSYLLSKTSFCLVGGGGGGGNSQN